MSSHVYRPDERPDVEVLVDGSWHAGELRGWWDDRGRRVMNVQWHEGVGLTRLDTVSAELVRRA